MREQTMYLTIDKIAKDYGFSFSDVRTVWAVAVDKRLLGSLAVIDPNDDLALLPRSFSYDFYREDSLLVVDRFFRFKNYLRGGFL